MARTRKKALRSPRVKHRASWRGILRFGLVAFPVQAHNAHLRDEGAVAFHQLHAKCGRRIHYEKVCPKHGPVPNDEIISGYELDKDRYVEIDPEELNDLRTEKERSLTLDSFIAPDELDPIYYDGRMYFLAPDGEAAEEPYAVLAAALRQSDRYAVGQVVFSGKEQIVLVRPYGKVLQMALLNYAAEMLDPAKLHLDLPEIKPHDRRLLMAEKLIDGWIDRHFRFGRYVDRHLELVRELVRAKSKGRKIEPREEEEDEPDVINLIDALKKSISKGRSKSNGRAAAAKRSHAAHSHATHGRTRRHRRVS